MTPIFTIDLKDLFRLRRMYKKAPHLLAATMANLVNSFAFGTRAVSLNIIRKRMVVRAGKFVDSRVRVAKARAGRLQSEMGSIASPRFTGWVEQELDKPVQRTRVFGIMARKGDIRQKAIGQSRLKPGAGHITPDQYPGRDERFRTTSMIMDIKRRGIKKSFVIRKHRKLKTGLYRLLKGRVQMLQHFKTVRQPRAVRWMSGAIKLYMTGNRVRNEWAKSIRHVLKLP